MSLFGNNQHPDANPNSTPVRSFNQLGVMNPGSHAISIFSDSIGLIRQNYHRRNHENHLIDSINSIDPTISIDELRANDYFSLKKNLVPDITKTVIDDLRRANAARRNQGQPVNAPGQQAPPQLLANMTYTPHDTFGRPQLFGGAGNTDLFGGGFPNTGGPGPFGATGNGTLLGRTSTGELIGGTGPLGGNPVPVGPFFGTGIGTGTGGPFGGTNPAPAGLFGTGTGIPFGVNPTPAGPFGVNPAPAGPFGVTGTVEPRERSNSKKNSPKSAKKQVDSSDSDDEVITPKKKSNITPNKGKKTPEHKADNSDKNLYAEPKSSNKEHQKARKPSDGNEEEEEEKKTNVQSHILNNTSTKAHLEEQNDASTGQTLRILQLHSGTAISAPGSYYHEMNKTIFISGFLGLLEDHNMKFSDDVIDSTDFIPKMFELLQNYGIHPPTENVPKFLVKKNIVSSSEQGGETKSRAKKPAKDGDKEEKEEEEEEKETPMSDQTDKVVPKPIAKDKPKEDHEVEEKKIDNRIPEAIGEKKEDQIKREGEGEGQKGEDEYEKIEEAGVTLVKLKQKTSNEKNSELNGGS